MAAVNIGGSKLLRRMTTNFYLRCWVNLNELIRQVCLSTHHENVARKSRDDGEKTTNQLKCVNVIVSWDDGKHRIVLMVKTGGNYSTRKGPPQTKCLRWALSDRLDQLVNGC